MSLLIPEPFRFAEYSDTLEQQLCRAPREKIRDVQSTRLRHVVGYAVDKIPFYRDLWGRAAVDPAEIRTVEDLGKLPTWNVDDQRAAIENHPPYGNCYNENIRDEIAFMLSTSGTTGVPRLSPVGYNDLPGMRDNMARCYHAFGLGSRDLIQVTFTYATMGAAWAFTWGAQGAGVGVLPASSGRTTDSVRQIDLMRRSGVTALAGTASFLLRLGEVAREQGFDPSTWPVRTVITAGELSSIGARKSLEAMWGAKVYDLFGSVDTLTWSSMDCEASRCLHGALGMHIWEDVCILEVLDPDGKPVAPGEYGEMCVTSWVWRSSPKIRFRTGDLIAVETERCSCGRTLARMMPVKGRVDHVIRIRATTIYPMAIEVAVMSLLPNSTEWMAEATTTGQGDRLHVTIEAPDPADDAARSQLENGIRAKLGLNVIDVTLASPRSTAEITGSGREPKVRRVFDRRSRH